MSKTTSRAAQRSLSATSSPSARRSPTLTRRRYTYPWTQISGRTTALSSLATPAPTFTVPSAARTRRRRRARAAPPLRSVATNAELPTLAAAGPGQDQHRAEPRLRPLAAWAGTVPTRPVANAVPPRTRQRGRERHRSTAPASTQAQGHPITYAWSQTAAPPSRCRRARPRRSRRSRPCPRRHTARDVHVLVDRDRHVRARSPVPAPTATRRRRHDRHGHAGRRTTSSANARSGPDRQGRGQRDHARRRRRRPSPNGSCRCTYTWTQVANGAPTVTLSNPNAQKPTFTAPPAVAPAGYVAAFNLAVTNGGAEPGHDSDTTVTPVTITVAASTPTVAVTRTPSGTVFTGDLVTLRRNITNPDGTTAPTTRTCGRRRRVVRPRCRRPTAANPTFIVPSSGANADDGRVHERYRCDGPDVRRTAHGSRSIVTKINTGKASADAALAAYAQLVADPSGRQRRHRADARHRYGAERARWTGSGRRKRRATRSRTRGRRPPARPVTLSDTHAATPTFTTADRPAACTRSQLIGRPTRRARSPVPGRTATRRHPPR